ncbi:hypothetical protein [Aliivibrio fischeri]|uniref:Outer membrane protein OmpA-like transmembrane domain-containing protein n=1 Tax=Aliivibrio fischeri TaxID=668 RepID=A0A844P5H6_ALIFS|nr:hypothetical protein [Aliivibrio fischeri]MUK51383.1 hypothetical protein [Aliivibrio fischeri]
MMRDKGAVSAKFAYPVTNNIAPYLKVGAASWVGAKTNDIAGVMRVGLSYRVFDYVALNVEYQYTDPIGNDVICEFAHQRFSLGITYHFSRATSRAITIEKPVVRERSAFINRLFNVEVVLQ